MKNLIRAGYFILFILIVVLFIHDNVNVTLEAEEEFSLNKYLENPQKYGGLQLENFGRIVNISQNHFYFNIGDTELKVFGSGIKI